MVDPGLEVNFSVFLMVRFCLRVKAGDRSRWNNMKNSISMLYWIVESFFGLTCLLIK